MNYEINFFYIGMGSVILVIFSRQNTVYDVICCQRAGSLSHRKELLGTLPLGVDVMLSLMLSVVSVVTLSSLPSLVNEVLALIISSVIVSDMY